MKNAHFPSIPKRSRTRQILKQLRVALAVVFPGHFPVPVEEFLPETPPVRLTIRKRKSESKAEGIPQQIQFS